MDLGSRERSSRARSAIALADQALSSGSNFLLLLLIASTSRPAEFGILAINYGVLAFALAVSRAAIGVPLNTDRPHLKPLEMKRREGGATALALLLGLAVAALAAAIAFMTGSVTTSAVVLIVAVPVVVLQDVWRLAAIADRRPELALLSDGTWLAVLLVLVSVRSLGLAEDSVSVIAWWLVGAVSALVLLSRAASSRSPVLLGLTSVARERRRWELAADAAVLALTPVVVSGGVAALASIEVTASFRGAALLFSPVNVLLAGVQTAALAESAGAAPDAAQRRLFSISALLAAVVAAYGAVLMLLPDAVGSLLLGDSWQLARPVLPFTLLEYVGLSFWTGAVVALRLRHRTRAALVLRVGFASAGLLLALGAAFVIGTGAAVGAGLALASLVTAVGASLIVRKPVTRGVAQVQ